MALIHTGHDGRRARIGRPVGRHTVSKNAAKRRTQKLLEALEGRAMFNAVAWTGSGDGSNWSDPANWSGHVVPGSADDVTINVSQNIQVTGARAAHSLNNAGSLTLANGSTLAIATTASSSTNVTLGGATLTGGAWTFTNPNGGFTFNNSNLNTINGATINGELMLSSTNAHVKLDNASTFTVAHLSADSSSIGFAPGSTITGTILMEGAGVQGRYVEGGGVGSLTVGATGAIKTVAGFGGTAYVGSAFWFGGIGALTNSGLISVETTGKTMWLSPTMTNAGTLRAMNGALLNISSSTWSSSGTISAAGGSTIALSNAWTNTGAFNINNSTLNLGGTFTTAGLNVAGFTRVGGTINLTGTLNNASSTMTFNGTTGTWNLAAGTINGGTIAYANGQSLALGAQGGTLNNVTVNGDLSFNADNAHVQLAGSTTFNTAHLIGNSTSIGFASGYTLNSTVLFEGAGTSGRYIEGASGIGTLTIGATGALKTSAGFGGSINIGNAFWYGGVLTLVNNGLIRSDVAGKALNMNASAFTNNGNLQLVGSPLNVWSTNWSNTASGTMSATNSTVALTGAWSNAGTLVLSNSPTTLGGTFSTSGFNFAGFSRSGSAALDLTGTMNNAGSTLTLGGALGTWNLKGGTIDGGQVTAVNATTLALSGSGGTLKDVIVLGDIVAGANNDHVRILGTTRFNTLHLAADSTGASFSPGYTLRDAIVLEGAGSLGRYIETDATAGTLTIAPSGSIKTVTGFAGIGYIGHAFWSGQPMTLDNQGLISSDVNGRAINITSTGGVTVSGTMRAQNGGALNVDFNGAVTVTASGIANVSRFRVDSLSIAGHASAVANGSANGTSVVKTLSLVGDAAFELNDNDLIVRNTPKATIENYVRTAYNFGGWDGPRGIFSSTARDNASGNTTLGLMSGAEYLDNNGASNMDGQAVFAGDTLVKYTYYGDVDFNGRVDVSDYNLIDFGFANHLTGWANGDADYSGGVDASDYNVIDFAFTTQTATL